MDIAPLTDTDYMRSALAIAERGLGRVAPNPSVGCVIVKNGVIIARGRTADGGRPHAEGVALAQAGDAARGACAYVTLEPCSHHGETPPCCEALVQAGVKRVVIACGDPDARVSGAGIAYLHESGVEVVEGVLEKEALELNRGFFSSVCNKRPFVSLKMAVSADGKIASAPSVRTQITGGMSGKYTHLERSNYDTIFIGIGTVLADNPLLTARVEGVSHKITRIVLDSSLRTPLDSQLVRTCHEHPLWVFCDLVNVEEGKREALEKAGVILFDIADSDLINVLKTVSNQGVTRLMVEGGAKVSASFLKADVCDEVMVFRAPHDIGDGGLDAISGHQLSDICDVFGFVLKETQALGQDLLDIYVRKD